jgi:hypothetical protein
MPLPLPPPKEERVAGSDSSLKKTGLLGEAMDQFPVACVLGQILYWLRATCWRTLDAVPKTLYFRIILEPHHKYSGYKTGRKNSFLAKVLASPIPKRIGVRAWLLGAVRG